MSITTITEGVTRIQFGVNGESEEKSPYDSEVLELDQGATLEPTIRMNCNETHQVIIGEGDHGNSEMIYGSQPAVQEVTTADLRANRGEIMSTCMDLEPTGESLVRVNGVQMTVKSAKQLGYLKLEANGDYVEAIGNPGPEVSPQNSQPKVPNNNQPDTPQPSHANATILSDDGEQAVNALNQALGETGGLAVATKVILGGGEISRDELSQAATKAGVSDEEMGQMLGRAKDAFNETAGYQVFDVAKAAGLEVSDVNPLSVFEYISEEIPKTNRENALSALVAGDPSLFRACVEDFLDNAIPDALRDRLEKRGVIFGDDDQQVTVIVNGQRMTYRAFRISGLMREFLNQ